MTRTLVWIVALATLVVPAAAAPRHRRHRPAPPPAQALRPMQAPQAFEFYPQNIEGGVSGNLPFNNQIRKLRDPLNANGAGG